MLASTRAWWERVWASPMAGQWIDSDIPSVVRLALLHDLVERQFLVVADGPIPHLRMSDLPEGTVRVVFESPVQSSLLSEMRQLEDRLGLSPMARRRLQWELPEDGAVQVSAGDELAARRKRLERFA